FQSSRKCSFLATAELCRCAYHPCDGPHRPEGRPMFAKQLRRAVEASPRAELPTLSSLLWKAYAAGQVTEAEASALSEAIALKRALSAAQKPVQRRLIGSRPRSPASLERRRRWAASGALPPAL